MRNRSVLIVTPFFAPQNHAAVFRAYKLAKYLPQFGWKPIVLTVDTNYEFNEDIGLLTQLPKETEVVGARYIEPTLRGLRMALGGRDRTFKDLKKETPPGPNHTRQAAPRSVAARAYNYLVRNWLQTPDAYWTWARIATRVATRIMKERDIHLVFTTAPPFSSLLIGESLHRNGATWVADFRDPLAYTKQLSSPAARIHHLQRGIVACTLASAEAITLASSSMASIYRDMFGSNGVDPVFIPTGVDETIHELRPAATNQQPYLLFAGEILPEFDTLFWETFAQAAQNPAVVNTGIKVLIVGTLALNRPRLAPIIDRFGLQEQVEFRDQMPQPDTYKLLRNAVAGLLVPGINSRWWTNAAKMTDYIGMRKPVVAVVPDPSEARTALTHSRLGIFLDGNAGQRVQRLTDFLLGTYRMPAPDQDECERYTARRQVQSFVEIFESLGKPKAMKASAS